MQVAEVVVTIVVLLAVWVAAQQLLPKKVAVEMVAALHQLVHQELLIPEVAVVVQDLMLLLDLLVLQGGLAS
jgi:hypothetical protein